MCYGIITGVPQTDLQAILRSHLNRLDQRIMRLKAVDRRFAWLRLGVFILGGVAVWAATFRWGTTGFGWALAGAVIVFSVVVFFHRRLDGWATTLHLWRGIQAEQLARLELDWAHLPPPSHVSSARQATPDADLDLTGPRSLHNLLDLSVSREGSQTLADWLTQPIPDLEQIHTHQTLVSELAPMQRFRDRLLLRFKLVSKDALEGGKLLSWLKEELPAGRLGWALPLATAWACLDIALFGLSLAGLLPAYWILSLSLYGVFYFHELPNVAKFLEAVVGLDKELDKFRALLRYLESYPINGQPNLERFLRSFRDPQRRPSVQLRQIKFATVLVGLRSNPVIGFLLNLITPWDFACAYLAARSRLQVGDSLPVWLQTWYELEALISLANFDALNPGCVFPTIDPAAAPIFEAQELGHPLIPPQQRVYNDFTVPSLGQVTIITGSNMAGKSTFIKTVGINLRLAYAGGPVVASRLRTSPFRLHTCLRVSDSITDGFSYFYAEVRCLKSLLDELRAESQFPLLYLIDEIFRGTNNRERLIGSRAYVRTVAGAAGVGLIATHDLELAGLAESLPQVVNFHFRDQVQDGRLAFDYKIRPGPSPTTNALKIMELEGLPVEKTSQDSPLGTP
jgi:hypothetical protein